MHEHYIRILSAAPEGKAFKTSFGEIKSLEELKNQLESRGHDFYSEYVNSIENHFANWVAGVFGDHALAESLRFSKSHKQAAEIIGMRLKYAELWLHFNRDITIGNALLKNYTAEHAYTPESHKFETLNDFSVTEGLSPSLLEAMKNEIKQPPSREELSLPAPEKVDEQKLLLELEESYPGLKLVQEAPKPRPGLIERLSMFLRK